MYKGMNQEELKKFYAAQKEQMAASKVTFDLAIIINKPKWSVLKNDPKAHVSDWLKQWLADSDE